MDAISFKVENLSVSYRKFHIGNISFELKNGDILGLIGRSGSGKSTIIRTLAGLKRPGSGKINILLSDKAVSIKDVIGYSPQNNSLYPFLTVEENMFTFGKLHGMNNSEIKKKSETLLKQLEIFECRKKKIIELSGGMQKRADLAVTLIHSPRIIILDEPFNGLDISLQKFIWEILKELASQRNIIIISSHLIKDIEQNCNQYGLVAGEYFYNTEQIFQTMKRGKEKSLEEYIEKLFTYLEMNQK